MRSSIAHPVESNFLSVSRTVAKSKVFSVRPITIAPRLPVGARQRLTLASSAAGRRPAVTSGGAGGGVAVLLEEVRA